MKSTPQRPAPPTRDRTSEKKKLRVFPSDTVHHVPHPPRSTRVAELGSLYP